MKPPTVSHLLFDLDGTLIDSVGLILDSYSHVHQEHLQRVSVSSDHYRNRLGTPLLQVYQELVEEHHQATELVTAYKKHNRKLHDGKVTLYRGIRPMLEQAVEVGIKLALVTSKGRDVARRGLHVCGIEGFFSTIVALEDVRCHKPDPEPVQLALELLGARMEGSLMIGDAPSDIRAGKAAGVLTGAALWGPFVREAFSECPPDLWLESPQEITMIFGERSRETTG